MADIKLGQTLTLKLAKSITRDSARKTVERLFLKDKAIANPLRSREKHFLAIPKRRGGRIWTKRPNKIHANLDRGLTATIKATPQALKDLASVADFVEVSAK